MTQTAARSTLVYSGHNLLASQGFGGVGNINTESNVALLDTLVTSHRFNTSDTLLLQFPYPIILSGGFGLTVRASVVQTILAANFWWREY